MELEFYTQANMQRSQNNLVKKSIASGFPETRKMNALSSAHSTVDPPIRRRMNALSSAYSTMAPSIRRLAHPITGKILLHGANPGSYCRRRKGSLAEETRMRPIFSANQRSLTLNFFEKMSSCKTIFDADGIDGQLAARCWRENPSQCTCMMISGCDWLICLKYISTGKL